MSKTQFKLDTTNVRHEILQADWMQEYIKSVAESQASYDSHVKAFVGFDRAKAVIYPNTKEYKE